jgi:uncharacterized membrane protein
MVYLTLKLLHVVAVVMFLGNITTGVFWKKHADRTKDPRVILATMEGIIRSDRWFTGPGAVLILLFGLAAALHGHLPLMRTGWIFWSILLFIVSGAVFGMRLVPLQRGLAKVAREGVERGTFDWERYHALSRQWDAWGAIALLAPFGALVLMVLKPAIPGL